MQERRIFVRNYLFFFAVVTPLLVLSPLSAQPQRNWKVGIVTPLSGNAGYGVDTFRGFTLGVREGRGTADISVLEKDNHSQPAGTAAAFQKLANIEKVDLVISPGSVPSHIVAPFAQNRHIPLLAFAPDNKLSIARDMVLRTALNQKELGEATAREAKRLGYKSVGIIYSPNDFTANVVRSFQESLPPSHIKAVHEFSPDAGDVRSILSAMKREGCSQLFICAAAGQPGLIARQAKDLRLRNAIFGCSSLGAPGEREAAGGALDRAWFYSAAVDPHFAVHYRIIEQGRSVDLYSAAVHYELALVLKEILPSLASPGEIIPALLRLGKRRGVLKEYEFVTDGKDQFMNIALEKYVSGEGVYR